MAFNLFYGKKYLRKLHRIRGYEASCVPEKRWSVHPHCTIPIFPVDPYRIEEEMAVYVMRRNGEFIYLSPKIYRNYPWDGHSYEIFKPLGGLPYLSEGVITDIFSLLYIGDFMRVRKPEGNFTDYIFPTIGQHLIDENGHIKYTVEEVGVSNGYPKYLLRGRNVRITVDKYLKRSEFFLLSSSLK